jgi:trigger factor
MKADLVDVSETRKSLRIEIPTDVVTERITEVAGNYSRRAKIPGFRPGKAPARVIKQRFRDQILHDVVHDLVPGAVDAALRERGVEAVSQPDIRDVEVDEGKALTFTALFDTVPQFDPGDLSTISVKKAPVKVTDEAVDQSLQQLRERAARFEPIEGRGAVDGDTIVCDLERFAVDATGAKGELQDRREDIGVEVGSKTNPPGFDGQLLGLEAGAAKEFPLHFPGDFAVTELAGTDTIYKVAAKSLKRRVVPALDDEFAKDVGDFENLGALRARVREDLEHEARHAADRDARASLMKQLATRVPFDAPASLVEREMDRRIEEFAQQLMDQKIDPRQTGIDWKAFRDNQREASDEAVRSALVLSEIAKREQITVGEDAVSKEIERYAEQTGRQVAAVRAGLQKEGGLSRVAAGLRREKSIDFIMSRVTLLEE